MLRRGVPAPIVATCLRYATFGLCCCAHAGWRTATPDHRASVAGWGGERDKANTAISAMQYRAGWVRAQRVGEASTPDPGASRDGPFARFDPEDPQHIRVRNAFPEVSDGPRALRRTRIAGAVPVEASVGAHPASYQNVGLVEHAEPPPVLPPLPRAARHARTYCPVAGCSESFPEPAPWWKLVAGMHQHFHDDCTGRRLGEWDAAIATNHILAVGNQCRHGCHGLLARHTWWRKTERGMLYSASDPHDST